jgi:hypothetical protein
MIRILQDTCNKLGLDPADVFGCAVEYLGGEKSEEARHTGEWAFNTWCDKVRVMVGHRSNYARPLDDRITEFDIKLPDWVESFCIDVLIGKIPILKGGGKCTTHSNSR